MSEGSVHITPAEIENGGFSLKTHQMSSVHTTPEEFENSRITNRLDLCLRPELGQGDHVIIMTSSFSKGLFSNSSSWKSVFKKLQFGDGLVWTVGLTSGRNKARFSNSPCVVWTLPDARFMRRISAVSNAIETIESEANLLIIYCLNCIRHGRNATYEPDLR